MMWLHRPAGHSSIRGGAPSAARLPPPPPLAPLAVLRRRTRSHTSAAGRGADTALDATPVAAPSSRNAAGAAPTSSPKQAPAQQNGGAGWRDELLAQSVGSDAAAAALQKLVLRGRVTEGAMPYRQATLRPVELKGKRLLQLSLLDARRDTTKNYSREEAAHQLASLLQLPWTSASLQSLTGQTLTVQVTRRGRALVQHSSSDTSGGTATAAAAGAAAAAAGGLSGPRPPLSHDRRKALLIPGDVPDPFLRRIGLQTEDGRIRAGMQDKFVQINKFVELLVHTGELDRLMGGKGEKASGAPGKGDTTTTTSSSSGSSSSSSSSEKGGEGGGDVGLDSEEPAAPKAVPKAVRLLDCGCGSAHLTFGAFHYLSNVRGAKVELMGVDTNTALMERSNRYCEELGIGDVASFHTSPIRTFEPPQPPDIVLALHACDTATDEALALGVGQGASIIMSVPCCHKDVHKQFARSGGGGRGSGGSSGDNAAAAGFALPGIDGGSSSQPQEGEEEEEEGEEWSGNAGGGSSNAVALRGLLSPLLRHGILQQRWLDLATDTLRAQLLRVAGYRVDVCEFVSGEHTPRNLLIRAVRRRGPPPSPAATTRLWGEYVGLRNALGVKPHLEGLLAPLGVLPVAGGSGGDGERSSSSGRRPQRGRR